MNKNSILITVLSVIAIFGFLTAVYYATNQKGPEKEFSETKTVQQGDHTKWSKDKKRLFVEYADLQCPACKNFHDFIDTQFEASGSPNNKSIKNVTFVFRHFPLSNIHPNAEVAAYAAEAAGNQGKFFEMVDKLYDNQEKWAEEKNPKSKFETYAKELKLDVEQFKQDSDSKEVKDRVDRDYKSGLASEVQGTPTLFLDGKKLEISTADDLVKALESK